MSEFKSEKIKIVIKTLLKNQRKTFEQLAVHLNCSIPTVKRILGKEDLTLSRLVSICEFLDVSIADVDTLTNEIKNERFALTPEQIEFFENNLDHFSFLMALCVGQSAEEIGKKHQLNRPSLDKYLIDLENLGLIRVNDQEAKTVFEGAPDLKNSRLQGNYFERHISNSAEFYIEWIRRVESERKQNINQSSTEARDNCIYGTAVVELTQESYLQWQREQQSRIEELEKRSEFEQKVFPKDKLKKVVITSASAISRNNDPLLNLFTEMWGPIRNCR